MSKTTPTKQAMRKRVGPFTVKNVIGEGGMGTVLRCHRKGEEVAVKMIRPTLLNSDDIRERFAREAELLQSVEHPNVARVVGYDADNKTSPWLATEYIDGPNLREWVTENGPMGEASWLELAEGILSGLAAIHETGILHRDIKPANVMLSPEGPKIIDFGISKEEGQTSLTNTQMFAGTLAYLPPERVHENAESQASDVFSAGLVLAVAARGEHPWGDETTQTELAILMNMANNEPELHGLTIQQKDFLSSLLAREPHLRPTALDALRILRGELDVKVGKKTGVTDKRKRTKRTSRVFTPTLPGAALRGALVSIASFVVTGLTGLLFAEGTGRAYFTEALWIASLDLSDSLRIQPSLTDLDWILSSSANLTTSVHARPTLLTLGIVAALFFLGRKYGPALIGQPAGVVWSRIFALILPTVVVATGLSWVVPEVMGMMPWDAVFAMAATLVAVGLGMISGGFAAEDSHARWWLQAIGSFAAIIAVLCATILIGGTLYGVLSPDFAASTSTTQAGFLHDASALDLLRFLALALLFLPLGLVVGVDSLVAGQGGIALREGDLLYLQFLAVPSSPNLPFAFTPQGAVLTALFITALLVGGMVAGYITARKRNQVHRDIKALINLGLLSIITGMVFFALFRVGVEETAGVRGTLFVHGSLTQSLIMLGFMSLGSLLVTGALWVGGHASFASFASRVFRHPIESKAGAALEIPKKLSIRPEKVLVFGAVAVTAVITLVIPPGFGLIERSWANTLTPAARVGELAQGVEISDGETLQELLPAAANSRWLPPAALEEAQPMVGSSREIDVVNRLDNAWEPGQLDAAATVTWPGTAGDVVWDVPLESSVERRFLFLRQVTYTPQPTPLTLAISTDPQLGLIAEAPIYVNGEPVGPGTYSLIPGAYTVEREGIDLVAPFEATFSVTGSQSDIYVPVELDLPNDSQQALIQAAQSAAEGCGSVRRSSCFSSDDVYRAQTILSGQTPSRFYTSESTSFEDAGLQCGEGNDTLISTSEIVRTVECQQAVSYETKYWDSRTIAEPVYSRRCASWWYSWWFGLSCLQWETYQSGTNYQTVRGDLIDTVRYLSELPIRVTVPAGLDETGDFVIGDASVN